MQHWKLTQSMFISGSKCPNNRHLSQTTFTIPGAKGYPAPYPKFNSKCHQMRTNILSFMVVGGSWLDTHIGTSFHVDRMAWNHLAAEDSPGGIVGLLKSAPVVSRAL